MQNARRAIIIQAFFVAINENRVGAPVSHINLIKFLFNF